MTRLFVFALALLLAACSSLPLGQSSAVAKPDLPARFAVDGRFALHLAIPGEAEKQASGRLSWLHQTRQDEVLLATPLGNALAELRIDSEAATLRTAQGREYRAPDADSLLRNATGYAMPVGRLARWLRLEFSPGARVDRDVLGRAERVLEDGWQIVYGYDTDVAEALPARIDIDQAGQVQLRLRLENWEALP